MSTGIESQYLSLFTALEPCLFDDTANAESLVCTYFIIHASIQCVCVLGVLNVVCLNLLNAKRA